MEEPKTIRKKLLGHSECFQMEGRRPRLSDREEAIADYSFGFSESTPVECVPKIKHTVPPKKLEKKQQKKTPKKRLFSCSNEQDIEEITASFDLLVSRDQPAKLPENYVKSSAKKPTSKVPQKNVLPRGRDLSLQKAPVQRHSAREDVGNGEVSMKSMSTIRKSAPTMQDKSKQPHRTLEDIAAEDRNVPILSAPRKSTLQQEKPQRRRLFTEDIAAEVDGGVPMEVLSLHRKSTPPTRGETERRRRSSEDIAAEVDGGVPMEVLSLTQKSSSPPQHEPERRLSPSEDTDAELDGEVPMEVLSTPRKSTPPTQDRQEQYRSSSEDIAPTGGEKSLEVLFPPTQQKPQQSLRTAKDVAATKEVFFSSRKSPLQTQEVPEQQHRTLEDIAATDEDEPMEVPSLSRKSPLPTREILQRSPSLARDETSPIFITASTLNPPSQSPLRPYRYPVDVRSSSQKISSSSHSSRNSEVTTDGQLTLGPADISSEPIDNSPVFFQEETTHALYPRPQTRLRPRDHVSEERCSARRSDPKQDKLLRHHMENEQVDMDHGSSSPEPAEEADNVSPTPSSSLESAAQIPPNQQSARRQSRSAEKMDESFMTTPRTAKPYRGLSTRKGQPWIQQVPVGKMTARRALFQGHVPLVSPPEESSGQHGEESEVTDRSCGNGDLMTEEDEDEPMIIDEELPHEDEPDVEILSPTRRLSRFAIPVTPLLLRKGADRIDGLPFSSGEAVRPDAAEWLHLKKSQSQESPVTPQTPVSNFPSASQRQLRAIVALQACEVRASDQADLPTETARTSPASQLTEEPSSQVSKVSSQRSSNWWRDESVLNALASLGVDTPLDKDSDIFGPTQLVTPTPQQSASTQESSVHRSIPLFRSTRVLKSSQQSGKSSLPSQFGRQSTSPIQGSSVQRFVPPLGYSGVLKSSQQGSKLEATNPLTLTPSQMSESSLLSDSSPAASSVHRDISFSFKTKKFTE